MWGDMDSALRLKADHLADKVKHYLVSLTDRMIDEASDHEFYEAFSYALKEEIMINWAASRRNYAEHAKRMVFYLSMEYLPGRIIGNNITNLQANDLVGRVMNQLGRDFSCIVTCEHDPGLGNGGLGRLASCFLDSLATGKYPAKAYGLRYQYGIFDQELWDGLQIERPDPWLLLENPWHSRRDFEAQTVKFRGRMVKTANQHGEAIYDLEDHEEVRALPYDLPIIGYCPDPNFPVITLRLWSTKESPRNFELQRYNAGQLDQAAENTSLTDVLYPADYHEMGRRVRLKQEFLLVSASVQDIVQQYLNCGFTLKDFADRVRIQINDTHPAIIVAELVRLLTRLNGMTFTQAWEVVKQVCGFTNHTILREALEEWDEELFRYLLPRQFQIIEQLNQEMCNDIRRHFPGEEERVRRCSIIEEGRVRMAHLAIYGSHKINGVAHLHGEIIKNSTFRDFYELYPDRFLGITNGVTQRRWLLHCNPELATLVTERIGDGWITDFSQMERLRDFAADEQTQQRFLEIKHRNKERLVELIRYKNAVRDHNGRPLRSIPLIDPHSIFDVQIKRIHEYKRQLLNALHAIMLYHELCDNPGARQIKRTIIVGGKAAPAYRMAKNIIRLIHMIGRAVNSDTTINDMLKVVFIENYNVSKAEVIIPAADLSEQISTAGKEASGTGNMKLSINGALTIGTDDGANIEMRQEVGDKWWPFLFGYAADEVARMIDDPESYSPWKIYSENPQVRRAVDALRDGSLARTDDEQQSLEEIYSYLMESQFGDPADRYFVLGDLLPYVETQHRVEALYANPSSWAEFAIHNMAGMAKFSSDRSIAEYAETIWGITPCPLDPNILEMVRAGYAEHIPMRVNPS